MSTQTKQSVETINTDTLIVISNNEPTISSKAVAEQLGVTHEATLKLIKKHQSKIELFGRVGFEILPLETKGGVQETTICYLNENQAIFVGTLSKNTERAVQYKAVLTQAFSNYKKLATEQAQKSAPLSPTEALLVSVQQLVNFEKVQKEQSELIKKQGEKLMELETKATGVVVDIHSVKDYTTVKELEKDYLGREINYFINQKYVEVQGLSFRDAHRAAWKDYKSETGFDYAGAKFATKESKQDFLNFLKGFNIEQTT